MATLLTVLGFAYTALCLWLIVRIINRRERWTKWSLATLLSLPVLYVASFGPACWLASRTEGQRLPIVYQPLTSALVRNGQISDWCRWYAVFGMPENSRLSLPADKDVSMAVIIVKPKSIDLLYSTGSLGALYLRKHAR